MRLLDWQTRLADKVNELRFTAFEWGKHDCCLWAATAVEAVTGTDPAADFRATYSTAAEAVKIVENLGGIGNLPTRWLGEPIDVRMANVGDIVLVYQDRESLGVCNGRNTLVVTDNGLYSIPTLSEFCKKAWRV